MTAAVGLEPAELVETAARLTRRIEERFPGAGLSRVAAALTTVAEDSTKTVAWIRKPNMALRVGMGLVSVLLVIVMLRMLIALPFSPTDRPLTAVDALQTLGASLEGAVVLGGLFFFLLTLESRFKRERALGVLHHLRSLAHVVDMHQLAKDPELLRLPGPATASSPARALGAFEMSRYFGYCSELLALIGKVATLYVQNFPDPVALQAVDQIEDLTVGLSQKLWQKTMLLN